MQGLYNLLPLCSMLIVSRSMRKLRPTARQTFPGCYCFTADSWCVWREKCTGRLLTCSEIPLRAAEREACDEGTTEDAKERDVAS